MLMCKTCPSKVANCNFVDVKVKKVGSSKTYISDLYSHSIFYNHSDCVNSLTLSGKVSTDPCFINALLSY